jgi:N-succinyldiaminopimelate aminotransferase
MARAALARFGTSIFSEMTRLANERGAINLSQGFPDFEGPPEIVDEAIAALKAGHNQYGRSLGLPALVEQIAAHRERDTGLRYDPMTEVVATAGATEAMAAAMLGLLEAGDAVVLFEPAYDSYAATAAMAGATVLPVTLSFDSGFEFDRLRLARVMTTRPRMIVVNTPHNPSGKVFTREELELIARMCVDNDVIAVTDEVYEHLTYDEVPHVALASLPGMRERTLSISSTGKTFSFTGWKVGWATGPAHLIAAVQAAHQFLTFCAATPLHAAMAQALARFERPFFAELKREYTTRRDLLVSILDDAGFEVSAPKGAYFVLANIRGLTEEDDVTFAKRLIDEAGVASIPPSAFYLSDFEEGQALLRFAFCKKLATLEAAGERLRAWAARRPR